MQMSCQLCAPFVLLSGKELRYPLNRRLGGPQGWAGPFGERKNILVLRHVFGYLALDTAAHSKDLDYRHIL